MTSSGVWMSSSNPAPQLNPAIISTPQTTALESRAVWTAVFMSAICLAPNSWDTMTEQPMLQPKAKARKIRVIS